MAVPVPTEVLEGIEYIRRSGLTNMLAVNVIVSLMYEFDLTVAASWVEANRTDYAKGVIEGFTEEK